jgi:hypothetical protein
MKANLILSLICVAAVTLTACENDLSGYNGYYSPGSYPYTYYSSPGYEYSYYSGPTYGYGYDNGYYPYPYGSGSTYGYGYYGTQRYRYGNRWYGNNQGYRYGAGKQGTATAITGYRNSHKGEIEKI